MTVLEVKHEKYYNTSFSMFVATEAEEGLYSLYFHNCPNYLLSGSQKVVVDFSVRKNFSTK